MESRSTVDLEVEVGDLQIMAICWFGVGGLAKAGSSEHVKQCFSVGNTMASNMATKTTIFDILI